MNKLFGVNLAGAEFDGGNPAQNVPGTIDKDYTYPTNLQEYQYYVNKGLTLFRVPLKWERIQRTQGGELDLTETAHIKTVLDTAQEAGAKVILDLHNYGQYQIGANNNQPVMQPVTIASKQHLVDVWEKLVAQFKDHPAVFGYEIMNEPHDLPDGASGWIQICQAVADAIAAIDTTHYIIIPGYDWQSADRWPQSNPNLLIKGTNIIYSAHCYFDGDASGSYWWGDVTTANGSGRLQHFIDWLTANKVQGIITEYGVPWGKDAKNNGGTIPHTTEWYPILEDFLKTIQNSDALIGGTAWSGGPWWGEYVLTIEPTNTFQTDRESMASYAKFPSTQATTPTPPTTTPPTTNPTPTPPTTTPPSTPGNGTPTPPTGNPGTPTPPVLDVATLNVLIKDAEALLVKLKALLGIQN